MLRVEHIEEALDVNAGQTVATSTGEWICYSSPEAAGAEYIAVGILAFSLEIARRDDNG